MDARLTSPLCGDDLLAVAGVAAAYTMSRGTPPLNVELATLGSHPDPAGLVVRVTHRLTVLGAQAGRPLDDAAHLATATITHSGMRPAVVAHSAGMLLVGMRPDRAHDELRNQYLDPDESAQLPWPDLVDSACLTLRSAAICTTGSPLGSHTLGAALSRACILDLPR